MSKALDPLRRLVVQFNARLTAHIKAFPGQALPQPSAPPTNLPHHAATSHATSHATHTAHAAIPPIFGGQFQVKVPIPAHKDGAHLMAHLNSRLNTIARQVFVPEPARVAAVNYACRSVGRPQMASLLSQGSQRMMHHRPLQFAVPHGFASHVGLSSSRGFCSVVGAGAGPAKMMAQLYAKPLGVLPNKLSEKDNQLHLRSQRSAVAKKRSSKRSSSSSLKKKNSNSEYCPYRLPNSTIQAFLVRAAQVEQQHQFLSLCDFSTPAITTETAISLAKVAGKSISELNELPKLVSSDDCPTNVDMCFVLDASPLWHLDTMVSALHTDSLKAPKQLNADFIEDLLEVTNYQYQHFLEVSAILQRLVQCPEVREISLQGYELRVRFEGTTLFDMAKFLQALGVDPKSPHFDMEEMYIDADQMPTPYFPEASVNDYYAPSLSDNETWDQCSSMNSSMMMYPDSERAESPVAMLIESFPAHESPWEGVATYSSCSTESELESEAELESEPSTQETDAPVQETEVPAVVTREYFPSEDPTDLWRENDLNKVDQITGPPSPREFLQQSTDQLDRLSSQILGSRIVNDEYFDSIRGFLESIEEVHRQSDRLFSGSRTQNPFLG
ncbi:hypothetical protein BGW38_003336 [Lunasporangiospora selenospora]|uniref:Uncharacterized protein n=1 Tax=Lunasporangiospora selenospora TaxID=979761 RepID=A0A9P6KHS6_9FUNG|nr:hypothetical protein BGW38_003336 [Lunasporangiospora selenospora]